MCINCVGRNHARERRAPSVSVLLAKVLFSSKVHVPRDTSSAIFQKGGVAVDGIIIISVITTIIIR